MHTILETTPRREQYCLLERLGKGGFAEVWRAIRRGGLIEHEVCIKRPLTMSTPQRRVLLEEARLLSRLRHAHVVSLLDAVSSQEGEVFLVLELVRGRDLRALSHALALQGRRCPPEFVACIGSSVCRALGAAQRAVPGGIVHRDVTPHNVLLSIEGEVKLTDFGIARAWDRPRWTGAGRIKGKRAYLSPEQARGEVLDVRSDLFAVGMLCVELLTGERPLPQLSTLLKSPKEVANSTQLQLARSQRFAPAGLLKALKPLLAMNREARPINADAAARAIEPFSGGLDTVRECLEQAREPQRLARLGSATPELVG